MPESVVLSVEDVTMYFGGIVALDGLSFSVREGEICGLIGPNGAGKTTMFNVISRLYEPSSGRVRFGGVDLLGVPAHRIAHHGIGRTFQNLALWPSMTVLENVMVGAHAKSAQGLLRAGLRMGTARDERSLRRRAASVLDELQLLEFAHRPCVGLSYGTLKRIELARSLAADPTLLLLDEPAAGLTHREVDALAASIRSLRDSRQLTVLLVEHHVPMVMGVSDHVVVLDFGRKIAEGTPAEVQGNASVIAAYLGSPDV